MDKGGGLDRVSGGNGKGWGGGKEEGAYVVEHFVAGFEAFGCEEIFEGFLLLTG